MLKLRRESELGGSKNCNERERIWKKEQKQIEKEEQKKSTQTQNEIGDSKRG